MSHAMRASKGEAEAVSAPRPVATHSSGDLRLNRPGDSFEREADRSASKVMAGHRNGGGWSLSRMTIAPQDGKAENPPQTEAAAGSAPPSVHEALRSPGKPLDHDIRTFMESRFGHDFGGVRIVADDTAARSAQAVASNAYTVGEKIVFNRGQYSPESQRGRRLLAHELTHVLQPAPSTLIQRQLIPVDGSQAPLAGPYTGMKPFPAPSPPPLKLQLQQLIQGATWKEIRKRVYPKESASGIARAKQRKSGAAPDLTGLGSIRSLESFATAMRGVQTNWGKTPDERVKSIGHAANVQLATAEVPEFQVLDKANMTAKADFTPSEWRFRVNEQLVTKDTLVAADAGELANATMHESRHAEQSFLAARHDAGVNKQDAASIATTEDIPIAIANAAVRKKFDATTDPTVKALGARMFTSKITDGASNQTISDAVDDRIAELDVSRQKAETAVKALDAGETPKTTADARAASDDLRAKVAAVEQAYKGYRNIPHEADAHEVGDAEQQAFQGWP
jgi:Domain of unknown function (DUF4157)